MTNNNFHPFDESELSPEDLAVLKAFDSMNWDESASDPDEETLPPVQRLAPEDDADFLREMRVLFVEEAGEDLATMQRVWHQLENAESISAEQFFPLRRGGHKIRGSAGAVNCFSMATIAGYVEDIAEQVVQGQLLPTLGLLALSPSLTALEETLQSVVAGSEDDTPLARLTPPLKVLTYDSQPAAASPVSVAETRSSLSEPDLLSSLLFPEPEPELGMPFLRVEPFRVEQLLMHSQQLTELRATLENSQTQVTQALQELHRAQVRLRQLQPMLSTLSSYVPRSPLLEEQSSSSLISRILAQAEQRGTHDRL
ncbi:MAG TPA: Hpt domain-containing protein, partial [Ktedonobacteraceae bacterium]